MRKFLGSNKTKDRLGRTILQGIIGVIIAYIDVIVGVIAIPNELRPMIVALVMAVLSPIMSELGGTLDAEYTMQQNTFNTEDFLEMFDYEDYDNEDQNNTAEE